MSTGVSGASASRSPDEARRRAAAQAATGSPAQATGGPVTQHQVAAGETLWRLVQGANPGVRGAALNELVDRTKALNGLPGDGRIQAGQTLQIPRSDKATGLPPKGSDAGAPALPGDVYTQSPDQPKPARSKAAAPDSKDKFQRDKAAGLDRTAAAAGASGPSLAERLAAFTNQQKPLPLKEADRARIREQAQDILGSGEGMGTALASALRKTNANERDELIKNVAAEEPGLLARMMSGQGLQGADQKLLATSVGNAYENGAIGKDALGAMLDPKNHGNPPNPMGLAGAVAASYSPKLQEDVALGLLQASGAAGGKDVDRAAYASAAAQAASGSPEATQALLEKVGPQGLDGFLDQIQPGKSPTLTYNPALGNLLKSAADIQPPNDLTNALFDKSVRLAGNDAPTREGLATFFQKNMDAVTQRVTDMPISAARSLMSSFTEKILFGDSFEGQKQLQEAFSKHIGQRVEELKNMPDEGSKAAEEKAKQLGLLVGSTEVGFERSLSHVQDQNASRRAMVDFLFDAISPISLDHIPDLSFLGFSLKDAVVGGARDMAYKQASEKEPSASTMIQPLYDLAMSISKDYWDELDSLRGGTHTSEKFGYE